MGCVDVCLEKKKGRFWDEAGAGYLPSGSSRVKVCRRWSRLLVDRCSWVLILGSACAEICRGWAHWESRVRCVGREARNWMVREPPWEQNGLPSMVNILWGVDAVLGNGYGIQEQNYVALLQGSEKSAGFHSRNLILDIQCFRLIMLNVMSAVKWLANQISNPVVQDPFLGGENMNCT